MQPVTTIGLDIAKSVFQVHGVDREGNVPSVVNWSAATSWLLSEAVALPSWDRSLRHVASLVAPT